MLERKDAYKYEGFPIWKIETGRLLQKFDPVLKEDGGLLHKSASVVSILFSAVVGDCSMEIKLDDVETVSESRSVEFNCNSSLSFIVFELVGRHSDKL